jgi:uncharacterized cupin superfamily protein
MPMVTSDRPPNLDDPNYDEPRETLEGFTAYRARLGYQLGSERIGLSQWLLPAGQAAYPYHFHLAEEELLVLLEGSLLLRSPAGWRRLQQGDVVRFPVGEDGAHQLVNDTDADVKFLAISTHGQPDVVIYPDEGKLCAAERTPDGSGLKTYFMMDADVPYDHGITRPEVPDVGAA